MASGKYWAGMLPANSYQDTGAVPAGKVRSCSINIVNNNSSAATIGIFVSLNSSPSEGDRIERKDLQISANGMFKLTGEIVGSGERIVIHSNVANVSARITGFEEVE